MATNEVQLLIAINDGNSKISKKLESHLGPVHGLGLSEYFTLLNLHEAQRPVSRVALADLLGLTASGVTRLLNPMEKLGLVERHKLDRDARQSLVKLSKAGLTKFQEAQATVEQVAAKMFSEVDQDQRRAVVDALRKIV